MRMIARGRSLRRWDRRQVDPHQFGRPAADIDDQQLIGLAADQRRAGHDCQLRLFLRFDDVQPQPGFPPNARHELGPFDARRQASVATSRIRCDVVALELLLADPERLNCPVYRRA